MRLNGGSKEAGTKFRQPLTFDKCIEAFGKRHRLWHSLAASELHAHL